MRDVASSPDAPAHLPAAAATLRIYEPVEAFPGDRRAAVLAAAQSTASRGLTTSVVVLERAASIRATAALPPRLTDDIDVVGLGPQHQGHEVAWFLLDPPAADGHARLTPAQLKWRSLIALEEFRRGIPEPMLTIFVPGAVHERASRELAAVAQHAVHSKPHAMVSPWQVPLTWLCAFAPRDRLRDRGGDRSEARQVAPPATGPAAPATETGLRYRAPMADARRAMARTLGAVRKTAVDWLEVPDVELVGRWLEEFHPRSVVELDYGSLRPPVDPAVVTSEQPVTPSDNSIDQMAEAMEALRAGRADTATAIVEALTSRWDAVRALEHAS
jgi:hypothetical protein